jgi:hypothetical protein
LRCSRRALGHDAVALLISDGLDGDAGMNTPAGVRVEVDGRALDTYRDDTPAERTRRSVSAPRLTFKAWRRRQSG